MKHTPGPWTAREGTTTGAEVVAKKPRGGDYVVARCGGKDREANARLIAAALELLNFAKEFISAATVERSVIPNPTYESDDVEWLIDAAQAAIAKAEALP